MRQILCQPAHADSFYRRQREGHGLARLGSKRPKIRERTTVGRFDARSTEGTLITLKNFTAMASLKRLTVLVALLLGIGLWARDRQVEVRPPATARVAAPADVLTWRKGCSYGPYKDFNYTVNARDGSFRATLAMDSRPSHSFSESGRLKPEEVETLWSGAIESGIFELKGDRIDPKCGSDPASYTIHFTNGNRKMWTHTMGEPSLTDVRVHKFFDGSHPEAVFRHLETRALREWDGKPGGFRG